MKEAQFYSRKENLVQCQLCPHYCKLKDGQTGICSVRKSEGDKLYSLNYGDVSSSGMDPIEKKPLYHFYPGSPILSIGTWGCNFKCPFCQNWRISQEKPVVQEYTPRRVVQAALEKNSMGIAYTYSEPVVWYEFVRETSELATEKGLKNVLVTNGYINQKPLEELLPYIDAANVDLKSAVDNFYQEYCQGKRKPVLESIKLMASRIHIELTTLVITDLNDDLSEMKELVGWIKDLDSEIPLHLSRYFPNYKMDKEQTSLDKMRQIYEMAAGELDYVYLGNTGLAGYNNTCCPDCGTEVISRNQYRTNSKIEDGFCPDCGSKIAGKF